MAWFSWLDGWWTKSLQTGNGWLEITGAFQGKGNIGYRIGLFQKTNHPHATRKSGGQNIIPSLNLTKSPPPKKKKKNLEDHFISEIGILCGAFAVSFRAPCVTSADHGSSDGIVMCSEPDDRTRWNFRLAGTAERGHLGFQEGGGWCFGGSLRFVFIFLRKKKHATFHLLFLGTSLQLGDEWSCMLILKILLANGFFVVSKRQSNFLKYPGEGGYFHIHTCFLPVSIWETALGCG